MTPIDKPSCMLNCFLFQVLFSDRLGSHSDILGIYFDILGSKLQPLYNKIQPINSSWQSPRERFSEQMTAFAQR